MKTTVADKVLAALTAMKTGDTSPAVTAELAKRTGLTTDQVWDGLYALERQGRIRTVRYGRRGAPRLVAFPALDAGFTIDCPHCLHPLSIDELVAAVRAKREEIERAQKLVESAKASEAGFESLAKELAKAVKP